MKAQLVGIQKLDYTSAKTDKRIFGVKLHCLKEGDINTDGAAVESHFISFSKDNENAQALANALKDIKLNSYINISYNRFGFIEDVTPIEA